MIRRRTFSTAPKGQVNDSNTLLLLHLDSSLVNTGIGGSSIGNPVNSSTGGYDTSDYKFGSASFYSNGRVIYFIGTESESAIKTAMQSDFTLDYWAKIDATTENYPDICLLGDTTNQRQSVIMVSHYDLPEYGVALSVKSTLDGGSSYIINRGLLVYNYAQSASWNHYAFVRKDNVLNLYVNGNICYSWSFNPTIPSTQQHVSIGGYYTGPSMGYWNSTYNRFDEIRFSNIARWTSNFTPPTAPY